MTSEICDIIMIEMGERVTIKNVSNALLSELDEYLNELEGIGICGSLARGTFDERKSDIDIFLVFDKPIDLEVEKLWWKRVGKALHRRYSLFVYTIEGLKEIPSWYTLRMASEGIVVWDKGKVKPLLRKIVAAARAAGLVEVDRGGYKIWKPKRRLKRGEIIEVRVKDE